MISEDEFQLKKVDKDLFGLELVESLILLVVDNIIDLVQVFECMIELLVEEVVIEIEVVELFKENNILV